MPKSLFKSIVIALNWLVWLYYCHCMETIQLSCKASQLSYFNMMAPLALNGIRLDFKVLDLVVLASKGIAVFQKISRNAYAWRIPNIIIALQSETAAKDMDNAALLKEFPDKF